MDLIRQLPVSTIVFFYQPLYMCPSLLSHLHIEVTVTSGQHGAVLVEASRRVWVASSLRRPSGHRPTTHGVCEVAARSHFSYVAAWGTWLLAGLAGDQGLVDMPTDFLRAGGTWCL